MSWTFTAELWKWEARSEGGWQFVTVPPEVSDEIDEAVGPDRAGFGSIKVAVRIGTSSWRTSVFPSLGESGFVLPVKKAVRTAQGLDTGSIVEVMLEIAGPDAA